MKRAALESTDGDKSIVVSFVNTKYRVPLEAARKIHRIALLLHDNPEATEFDFPEYEANHAFDAQLATLVPHVDRVLFDAGKIDDTIKSERDAFCTWIVESMLASNNRALFEYVPSLTSPIALNAKMRHTVGGGVGKYWLGLDLSIPTNSEDIPDKLVIIMVDSEWRNRCISTSEQHMVDFIIPSADCARRVGRLASNFSSRASKQDIFFSCVFSFGNTRMLGSISWNFVPASEGKK